MRNSSAPVVSVLVAVGLLLFLLPGDLWLSLAERFSPDNDIGDAGVRRLASNVGRIAGIGLLLASGLWANRRLLATALESLATCPAYQWFFLITALVVMPRGAYLAVVHTTPHADLEWYMIHARNLAGGLGYLENGKPTAFWPIGYPLFIASLYRMFGQGLQVVKLAQVLLSIVNALLIWRVGRTLMHERQARLASAIFALCPSLIMFTELPGTEILFGTQLLLLWALLLTGDASGGRPLWIGLVSGLGMLTKPVLQPWPALAILLARGLRNLARTGRDVLVVYAVAIAICMPWVYRNTTVFERPVGLSTNTGFNLYVGNAEGANGGVRVIPTAEWAPLYAMENEAERDAVMQSRALEAIRADPGRFLGLLPTKWKALLGTDQAALRWAASAPEANWTPLSALLTRIALDGYYYVCLLLTGLWLLRVLAGRWRTWTPERRRGWLVVWSWVAYQVVVYSVFYGDPRYHQAMWPVFVLAAADSLHRTRTST